jgi:hypothetical protein
VHKLTVLLEYLYEWVVDLLLKPKGNIKNPSIQTSIRG